MNLLNNEQKMLDILFAKRNKSYGAYAIRSAYGSTVFRSLFIVIITVATSAGLAYWLKESNAAPKIDDIVLEQDTSTRTIVCKITPPEPPNADHNKKTGSAGKAVGTLTVSDHPIDTVQQIVTTNTVSTTNTTTGTGSPSVAITGTPSTGTPTVDTDPKTWVDENPEFEGGHAALIAFVRKNLVYPSNAIEVGKQGTVYAKFVVDETGKVSNIFLQNNLGYGLDDEAMRVLKMIPKFKSPGKVQGKAVKTYYQIPIKFKLG